MLVIRILLASVLAVFLTACNEEQVASVPDNSPPDDKAACQYDGVAFYDNFQMARIDGCQQISATEFELTIEPESLPAHHSPWYAFQVSSDREQRISVTLKYTEKAHRYAPKTSLDKKSWALVPQDQVVELDEGKSVRIGLDVGPTPIYVAGQEIIDNDDYDQMELLLAQKPFVTRTQIGSSEQGRPIYKLETNSSDSGDFLVLTGRQHPPEITGALGMLHFVDVLMADTPLAQEFRSKVNLLIVFNMNPDGVEHGHWRKNVNGIDLNRDWGPMEQAETRVVINELQRFLDTEKERMRFFVDFHSTGKDVIYTLKDSEPADAEETIFRWIGMIDERLPEHPVVTGGSYNPAKFLSKNYVFKTFGAPAVTYEMGDHTDRELIRTKSVAAAEEMMKLLLSKQ
ncbi:M14 family metallopeptidase [Porticoccus sp. W117]|uniref:M14 family metallopeptidase n=1 Tax=Porticoccus sp. W117 TaxID=3054777 RepID=UPI002599AACE|nr:M14 family metallopeptidase [Porticoccus sp. W117]MDM3871123.1 M14 family metallopeptidase [Porticoccus sp. W117]